MSSVLMIANALVDWKRSTAYLLDPVAVAGSIAPTRQPVRKSCVQVKLTGAPNGTVVVAGLVDGVADAETLTWAGSAVARATVKQFSTLTGFTASLTGASTIEALAMGPGGQPQADTYVLKGQHPVQMNESNAPRWQASTPGSERANYATCRVQYEEVWAPRQGDIVADLITGTTWQVVGQPRVLGTIFSGHWHVRLEQNEGA